MVEVFSEVGVLTFFFINDSVLLFLEYYKNLSEFQKRS